MLPRLPLECNLLEFVGAKNLDHLAQSVVCSILDPKFPARNLLDHGLVIFKPLLHLIESVVKAKGKKYTSCIMLEMG